MDQRGIDNQRVVLTAAEATRALGVKLQTLYAYASRGLIRTVAGATHRERGYLKEDVERLKARAAARSGHAPVAAGALRWGDPVLESSITEIRAAEGPAYRGRLAVDLAREGLSYEAVAELLWTAPTPAQESPPSARGEGTRGGGTLGREVRGDPRNAATRRSPILPGAPWTPRPSVTQLRALQAVRPLVPKHAHPFTALQLVLAALSANDPLRHGATPEQELDRARTLLPLLAASAGLGVAPGKARAALSAPSYAATVATALGAAPSPATTRLVEQALIVAADHELNASAFAARVAASSGADLYACLTAALAVLTGPYHGGLTDRVEALVREAHGLRRPTDVIAARLQRGEEVPGYSHPLYPHGDPRATFLLDAVKPWRSRSPELRVVFALVDAMADAKREPPSLDLGLVAVAFALQLPPGSAAALFALGRCAGWVAHALEQRKSGVLLRPRARFVPASPVV